MEYFRPFFTATIYAKLLQADPYGRISIMQFFNYVMRKTWLHQTRIGLALYDVAGQGFLRESVSLFIFSIICCETTT